MSEPAFETIRLVAVKFRPAGRHYDFNAHEFDLQAGARVIVETDRGRALGTLVSAPREVARTKAPDDLKSVVRVATDEDLSLAAGNATREREAFRFCQQRIQERKMEMKLVRAEYLFDGSKIIFYFTADGRVDFRELVKDLAHYFHTRIEMRQIGVRDEAKLTGGLGICGRELCCCTFLNEFAPVSVKMAKEQGLALNPSKISGQCGRLLCCLAYEFETYCDLKKSLPKCGRRIPVEGGEAEVIEQNVLAQTVTVRLGDGKKMVVPAGQCGGCRSELPSSPTPVATPKVETPPANQPRRERSRPEKPRRDGGRPASDAAPTPPRPQPEPASPPAEGESEGTQAESKRRRGRRRSRRK